MNRSRTRRRLMAPMDTTMEKREASVHGSPFGGHYAAENGR
ncbi:hypothetical protein [Salibacterium halotolerans]|nr:hypothetical protein [Salibacterium halotolerans]